MSRARPLRLAPEWDDRFTRMVLVSAMVHLLAIGALIVLAPLVKPRPLPLVAYTVELTDPNALGGRLPPGAPGRDLSGGPTEAAPPAPKPERPKAPEPEQVARVEPPPKAPEPAPVARVEPPPKAPEPAPVAKAEPPPKPVEPTKPPEPKPEEAVKIPDKPKPPEPKPAPAKPEPKKPEAKAPEPKRPEPAKPQKPEERPATAERGGTAAQEQAQRDAYAAAAERWRGRSGGGIGGTQEGSGPIGAGGEGKGGGGQLVGIEFLAYRQRVIDTVKGQWVNVIGRAGLLARVRFEIAPDGSVSAVRLEQSSGDAGYDASALRAVQRANPLPPPPVRYANDFREFVIEFHSEEPGGQRTG